MGPSEDTGQDAAYPHERYRTRHGRHGRPGPFGGRLRLPTLRFSGAAMAMSTVVGISIATTLLLNEQQGVGRRAGVARVGSSAPPPSPAVGPDSGSGAASGTGTGPASGTTADRESDAPAATAGRPPATPAVPVPGPTGPDGSKDPNSPTAGPRAPGSTPGPRSATPAAPRGGSSTGVPLAEGPPPRHGVTGEPAGGHGTGTGTGTAGGGQDTLAAGQPAEEQPASRNADRPTADRPAEEPAPTATAPATPAPSPSPTASRPLAPAPGTPTPAPGRPGEVLTDPGTGGTDGTGGTGEKGATGEPGDKGGKGVKGGTDNADDLALTGAALVQPLGRDGTRHLLALTVTEPLTALQAEFRLAPGGSAPGAGTVWTDLAGAVITTHQERGAAVYRFTTPPGTDVRPGRYTFAVLGIRTPAPRRADPRTADPRTIESWKASAFGIDRPRAVAALGTFAAPSATGTEVRPGPTAPARRDGTRPLTAPAR
ncbi:hypothetical protein [Kitasatospora purpeofusca]|uniref:hypothetical protein n=2 Tax=Kitasatospora TaxID=2063 RepID=UPI0004BFCA0F|nr:hypothetical protein [Kitasatospora purpeofusca]